MLTLSVVGRTRSDVPAGFEPATLRLSCRNVLVTPLGSQLADASLDSTSLSAIGCDPLQTGVTKGDKNAHRWRDLLWPRGIPGLSLRSPPRRPHYQRGQGTQAARTNLANAVSAAHEAGVPLRAIAAAANVSHEQVRLIVKRAAR